MVAAGGKFPRHAAEQPAAVMQHGGHLAVHQARGAHDFPAEHFHQGLVAETYAEDRNAPGERLDHAHRNAGVARRAGSGRNDQMRMLLRERLLDRDGVVAVYVDVRTQHQKGLHQVVGEGVVVVDEQYPRSHAYSPSAAMLSARRSTALFAMTSSYSAFGELSATMP